MAKYAICKNCKHLIEYKPEIKHEGGTIYTTLTCPLCKYTRKDTSSYIHYGNDGKKIIWI